MKLTKVLAGALMLLGWQVRHSALGYFIMPEELIRRIIELEQKVQDLRRET